MENQTKTTLTLNPEEEKQSNTLLEGVPVRKTVQPIAQTQAEYSAGSIDESMLRLCGNLFYCNIIELSYQWQE